MIVFGLDDTGSYGLWENAKKIACDIVTQLRPGDIFYFRRITEASYTDECTVFRLELPLMAETGSKNPFDRKARQLEKAFELRIRALKYQAIQSIGKLKPTGARKTDIHGFLAVASEKIKLAGREVKPILIIASDLQDNVRLKVDLDLSGAWVAIVGFQVKKNPKDTQKLKKSWRETLGKSGATRITFIRAEERFNLNKP